MTGEQRFPEGWDAERVQRVIDHYDTISDEDLAAEHEQALADENTTWMAVPNDLVKKVRELIAREGA